MKISEVIALPKDTWINDGFNGVVREIQDKVAQKTQKKFWVLTIADPTTDDVIEAACFTYPKVKSGDQIDVVGSGIKRKDDYQGTVKVSWGDKAEIIVVGQSVKHEAGAAAATSGDPLPQGSFHNSMKREALLLAHCVYYAVKVVEKVGAAGMPDIAKGLMQPEHIRNMAISLAIRAEKLGLASVVPAFGAPEAAAKTTGAGAGGDRSSPGRTAGGRPGGLTDRQEANLDDRPGAGREIHADADVPF